MIRPIGQSPGTLYSPQVQARPIFPAGAKEAFAIDLDKLFTPAERKTLANIKEHARDQGLSETKIQELEGSIITSKYGEKSISHDIPIKEIIDRQIRGIKDGFDNGNGPSLTFLQDIYNNFQKFQAVELFA